MMALALALGVASCADQLSLSSSRPGEAGTSSTVVADSGTDLSTTDGQAQTAVPSEARTVSYSDTDLDATWDTSTASLITFADASMRFDGTGATAQGSTVTITSAGTYIVSGTAQDGQIVVNLEDDGTVKLVLNGANITCSTSAPIYVKNADKVVITLAEGTQNLVTDGASYVLDDSESGEPNAAVFSKSDLSINGTGSLMVKANYDNGIASKDDLKIVSGSITVDAANDALKGRDCIGVKDGLITLTAGGDGLQSTNDVDAAKGYIAIEGGTLGITAGNDGIQAQTTLLVLAGDITLSTGGGITNSSSNVGQPGNTWGQWDQGQQRQGSGPKTGATDTADPISAKGLKGAAGVYVEGGTITIDSSDDSIHSNNAVTIDGGTVTMASGDQGIQGDVAVDINGGDIDITQSREGIESAVVTIKDGNIHVRSNGNGINTSNSTDGSSGEMRLTVDGGYLYIDANGDGIDTNEGSIYVNGGTVFINGPASNGDGPLDYQGECKITGGHLFAVGSSGMAQAASGSSTQYSVMVNFDSTQAAGTLVHIEEEDGNNIFTFAPTKQYQSVVLSSPDIKDGATYAVFLGGSSTGTVADGFYLGGTYTPGTEYTTLTVSGVVTTSGAAGGMMPGGMPSGGRPGAGGRPGH
jgi:hypothetical protein